MSRVTGIILDLAGIAGVGSIAYGCWLIYEPAGYIVGGALVLMSAFAATSGRRKRKATDDGTA